MLSFDPIAANVIAGDVETAAFNLTITESATLAESQSDTDTLHIGVVESATATDNLSIVVNLIVNETMHLAESTDRSLVFNLSRTDTLSILDSDLPYNVGDVEETLSISAIFELDIDGRSFPAVHESLTITDDAVVSWNKIVAETMHAHTQVAANDGSTFNMAVKEFLHPVTIHHSNIKTNSLVIDALGISESIGVYLGPATGIWNLTVSETATIADHATDPLTFSSPGVYFWGYKWAYDAGVKTVAIWCAGLDCGDRPIDHSGYVFVPWRSDPDELFSPKYLFDLSNNPPVGGFGASACNIDITANGGTIERVVVDLAIGLPYKSELQVLRPNAIDQNHLPSGPSLAETRRVHQFGAQLVNAQGLSVGTNEDNLRPIVFHKPNGDKYLSSQLRTGIHWDVLDDDYDFDGMLMMQMFRPYPATIAAVISFMKTMDRG